MQYLSQGHADPLHRKWQQRAVQVWKSLAWKINKLELALQSVPHALWGAAPALLVLISVIISSYTLPALFRSNSQKVRTRTEPSQEPVLCEARSGDPAEGSHPSWFSWKDKYHRPSSWSERCIKHALVGCVTQCKMAFPPFPSIQIFKNRVKMGIGRLVPHASETKLQQLMRWISRVLPTALQELKPQPVWQKGQRVSTAAAVAVWALPIRQPHQEKPCTHQSQIQQRSGAHTTAWEREGSHYVVYQGTETLDKLLVQFPLI